MSITKEQAEQAALQAKKDGYRPLTIGYELPEEQWMLDNVLADMKRGILRVRIIHGKGTGTLRTGVHQLLAKLPEVEQIIWPADETSGSWGATWVLLRPLPGYSKGKLQ